MLAEQRQMLILEEVRQRGAVRVSELTGLFSVSDMTIRRDLDALSTAGLVDKVHGGATLPGRLSSEEPGFEAKSHRQLEEKEAIARAAAELVEPGQAIGLTAGTTTWRLAHRLLDTRTPDLTVVTNSMRAADVLRREKRPDLTVILTGGVGTPSDALVGPVAVATLRSLHIDLLFLGVHGISADVGFTTPNILESETNAAFLEAASQVAVVADSTKWGVRGLSKFAKLDDAQILVSDWWLPSDAHTVLSEHVERLIIAEPARGRRRGR